MLFLTLNLLFSDMSILGIKFAPLNVPFHRRLQTLSIGLYLFIILFAPSSACFIILYFIFYTKFWLLPILYLLWIWVFDKRICEKGGRRVEWIRRWKIWRYAKEYFPINILKESSEIELDPKRNYLFCSFPHGLLSIGVCTAFGTNCGGFRELFPKHTPHVLTLKQYFFMPLLRDYLLSMGACAVSDKSINFLMSNPKGGNAAVLVVGGVKEIINYKCGEYRLELKKRKGFIKLAFKNGSPLVPMFSFGENDIYDVVNNSEGSLFRMFQGWIKNVTGFVPVIPLGRGFFQYSFGLLPHRKPINIVGKLNFVFNGHCVEIIKCSF